jgi:hypothetical protein
VTLTKESMTVSVIEREHGAAVDVEAPDRYYQPNVNNQLDVTDDGSPAHDSRAPVLFSVKGVEYEVSEGKDVTIQLADQGPVLKGSPAESWTTHYRREDGTLMVPSVPTITDTIPTITSQMLAGSESSEATDAVTHGTEAGAPDLDQNSSAGRRRLRLRKQ